MECAYSVHLSSDSQLVMLNAPPSLIEVETMHSSYIAQRNAVDVHYETHLLRH